MVARASFSVLTLIVTFCHRDVNDIFLYLNYNEENMYKCLRLVNNINQQVGFLAEMESDSPVTGYRQRLAKKNHRL